MAMLMERGLVEKRSPRLAHGVHETERIKEERLPSRLESISKKSERALPGKLTPSFETGNEEEFLP